MLSPLLCSTWLASPPSGMAPRTQHPWQQTPQCGSRRMDRDSTAGACLPGDSALVPSQVGSVRGEGQTEALVTTPCPGPRPTAVSASQSKQCALGHVFLGVTLSAHTGPAPQASEPEPEGRSRLLTLRPSQAGGVQAVLPWGSKVRGVSRDGTQHSWRSADMKDMHVGRTGLAV